MRTVFWFICFLLATVMASAGDLSSPDRSMSVPTMVGATAVWSKGHLIKLMSEDGSISVYNTVDNTYKTAVETRSWPEGTTSLFYSSAAAAKDSALFAASGSATASDGGRTGFIALIGPQRKIPLVIQLPGTAVFRIAFAE